MTTSGVLFTPVTQQAFNQRKINIMKTITKSIICGIAVAIIWSLPAIHADDKDSNMNPGLKKAQGVVDGIRQSQAPQVSTTTRTQAQAISDYKNSGQATGSQHGLHINDVPSPVDKMNPRNDPAVQAGIDKTTKEINARKAQSSSP